MPLNAIALKNSVPPPSIYPAEWVNFMLQHVTGPHRAQLQADSGIDLDKPEFSDSEVLILVSLSIIMLDDENFGHCATKIPARSIAFVQQALNSCDNLRDGLDVLCNLVNTIYCDRKFEFNVKNDICEFRIYTNGLSEESGAAVEISQIITYCGMLNFFIGRPISIKAMHARSALFSQHVDFHTRLGAPVIFGQHTGIDFSARYLDELKNSPHTATPAIEALRWYLLSNKLGPITDRTELSIFAVDDLIASINVITSTRNVDLRQKRRISIEKYGATLRDLKNAKKAISAIMLLCCTKKSVSYIATTLGFSDYGSFHRFFRNYTSVTPSEYRKLYAESDTIGEDFALNVAMKLLEHEAA